MPQAELMPARTMRTMSPTGLVPVAQSMAVMPILVVSDSDRASTRANDRWTLSTAREPVVGQALTVVCSSCQSLPLTGHQVCQQVGNGHTSAMCGTLPCRWPHSSHSLRSHRRYGDGDSGHRWQAVGMPLLIHIHQADVTIIKGRRARSLAMRYGPQSQCCGAAMMSLGVVAAGLPK